MNKIPTWVKAVVLAIIIAGVFVVVFAYGGCTRTERSGNGHPPTPITTHSLTIRQ